MRITEKAQEMFEQIMGQTSFSLPTNYETVNIDADFDEITTRVFVDYPPNGRKKYYKVSVTVKDRDGNVAEEGEKCYSSYNAPIELWEYKHPRRWSDLMTVSE